MKLVACPDCHAQYDVSLVLLERFACRCGKQLENRALKALDAEIHRCASCGAHVGEAAPSCTYCGAEIVREPGLRSLICPECFARNADAARFCTACGVGFEPEPLPAEATQLGCPGCGRTLSATQVADVTLAECTGCRGLWVPADHFERLIERATELRRAAGPGAAPAPRVKRGVASAKQVNYRRCPVCQALMQRRNFRRSSGVIVDVCHRHGSWLDADELEAIAGFVLSGAEPSAVLEEEHRRAAAEAGAARIRIARPVPDSHTSWSEGGSGLLLALLRKILD